MHFKIKATTQSPNKTASVSSVVRGPPDWFISLTNTLPPHKIHAVRSSFYPSAHYVQITNTYELHRTHKALSPSRSIDKSEGQWKIHVSQSMLHTLHYGHANASHTCLLIKIVVVVVFCRYVCGGRLSNSSLVRRALHNPPKINTQFLSFTFEKQKIYLFTFIQSTSQAPHTHTLCFFVFDFVHHIKQ